MNKQQAIFRAADAVQATADAINKYGPASQEAKHAQSAAKKAVDRALAAGATRQELHDADPRNRP
ncbi:hypothetical protein ACH4YO_40705 [Streptomyces noursei]|uniref:hypothetical protein n=1 Tax=Streptomyces noursei TaxID=1971 RepID=UPI0033DB3E36